MLAIHLKYVLVSCKIRVNGLSDELFITEKKLRRKLKSKLNCTSNNPRPFLDGLDKSANLKKGKKICKCRMKLIIFGRGNYSLSIQEGA